MRSSLPSSHFPLPGLVQHSELELLCLESRASSLLMILNVVHRLIGHFYSVNLCSLYILDTSPLPDKWLVDIKSCSVTCLHFSVVSFNLCVVHVFAHPWGSRKVLGILLYHFLPYSLEMGSLKLEPTRLASQWALMVLLPLLQMPTFSCWAQCAQLCLLQTWVPGTWTRSSYLIILTKH